jgi:signal transduction histidine kinase
MRDGVMPRWRTIYTVRVRVTLIATITVAVVLAVMAIGLVALQHRVLLDQLDEALQTDVAQVASAFESSPDANLRNPGGDDDAVAQVVTLDGAVVASSANAAGRAPLASVPGDEAITTTHSIEGDEPYRLVSARIDTADGRMLVVHVASPLDDIDETTRTVIAALAVAVPLVTVLLGAVVFVLVGRTLRSIERIRREVDTIGPDELDHRVPQPPGDDEISRLATTMNTMLDRLERGDRRQRRFVADASHELRTPLARIRTELEVDLRHPETADQAATARSVLDEIDQLQRLVDDLLVLARHDADGVAARSAPLVDLDDIVLDEVRAASGSRSIDAARVSAAQVHGDSDALRRVTRNLLDNAVRHARDTVRVTLTETSGDVILTVTDDGPGIPAERRDDVFERFTTLDDARTGGRHGTGLGLAIARAIVTAHGGAIEVDAAYASGARLVVRLPATRPTAPT